MVIMFFFSEIIFYEVIFKLLPTGYIQTKACVNSYIFRDNTTF